MGTTINRRLLALFATAVILTGCTPTDTSDTSGDPVDTSPSTDQTQDTQATTPTRSAEPERAKPPRVLNSGGLQVFDIGDASETLPGVFYFDYDQAIVKRGGHAELDKHADVLKANRSYRVRLEGHADERGTREYNLALGERRANAVRAYLVAQGASRAQIEVISYGEEKPVMRGSGERAWAKNRRVEMKYRN